MDKIKPEQGYGVQRLQSKNARSAIVQRLAVDFNLTPIIAEAFYQQFSMYYQEHANVSLSSGEIAYEAVSAEEPAGKHIRLSKKVTIRLKLIDFNHDLIRSVGLLFRHWHSNRISLTQENLRQSVRSASSACYSFQITPALSTLGSLGFNSVSLSMPL